MQCCLSSDAKYCWFIKSCWLTTSGINHSCTHDIFHTIFHWVSSVPCFTLSNSQRNITLRHIERTCTPSYFLPISTAINFVMLAMWYLIAQGTNEVVHMWNTLGMRQMWNSLGMRLHWHGMRTMSHVTLLWCYTEGTEVILTLPLPPPASWSHRPPSSVCTVLSAMCLLWQ